MACRVYEDRGPALQFAPVKERNDHWPLLASMPLAAALSHRRHPAFDRDVLADEVLTGRRRCHMVAAVETACRDTTYDAGTTADESWRSLVRAVRGAVLPDMGSTAARRATTDHSRLQRFRRELAAAHGAARREMDSLVDLGP